MNHLYRHRRDTAAVFGLMGLLFGLIVGLASCEPQVPPQQCVVS
jgi:hypothetical protein